MTSAKKLNPLYSVNSNTRDGGEPPMSTLEQRVSNLETDVAVIRSNYSTKADIESVKTDMHKEINKMLIWLISAMFTVAGLSIAAVKLLF
ncbi:hypothetical protein P0F23_001759 [Vibrio metschnikovii]|nr:hypothetical protein [Vibrio metschnikovii]